MVVHPPNPGLGLVADRSLLVLEQTPFPLEIVDQDGEALFTNLAYRRTFLGDSSPPANPSVVFSKDKINGLSREEVFGAARADGLWRGDVELPVQSHQVVCFRLSVFPIHYTDQRRWEFAIVYEDIQIEVDARDELVRQQNLVAIRARQAQMGELLSMIAHQWRQPLTVVMSLIGNIQLKAKMGSLDPDYLAVKLERISQTVHFLSETIDSFRNFYAPTKYKTEEDLTFLTRRALELLSPSLKKLGAVVEFDVAAEPLKVKVFSGELVQVALELITNAREALVACEATPTLRLAVYREGSTAVLRVQNNGAGIPADVLPHIYDPYYTTKDGVSGTGLGLYMAQLIVETHHGGVLAATSADGWTSFTCTLPLEGSA